MPDTTMPPTGVPICDVDPFSEESIRDPYSWQAAVRDPGPLVWLRPLGVWATGRYAEAQAVLSDWETFCSSAGVGITNFRSEKPWRPPSKLLEADPPDHTRRRKVADRVMSYANLRKLRPTFESEAAALVDRALEKGTVDGVTDIAQTFILKVFPDSVGLGPDNRPDLLAYGNMVFNAFGPHNEIFAESTRRAEPVTEYVMGCCLRSALSPDGLGAQVYEAADAGEVSEEEALFIVRSMLSAGLDTTVDAIGNALYCFASNPAEWDKLRADPARVREAIEEVLRFDSPFQGLFRTTARATELAGVAIDDNQKIFIALGAANRDPAEWEDPDRFDIGRNASGHLGLGYGIHACLGQTMARLEMQALFGEMAKKVARIEIAGPSARRLNNTLHGFETLPLALHPA